MIRVEKTISAEFGFYSEFSDDDKFLLETAMIARAKAQAPYSHYTVGAAVSTHHEGATRIFSGCNVERCTWTQTTHAEQNAIDSMVACLGPKKIIAVAVAGSHELEGIYFSNSLNGIFPSIEGVPVPCGHCLQIIWENCFGDYNARLLSVNPDGIIAVTTIGDAFPMRFGPRDLGVEYK